MTATLPPNRPARLEAWDYFEVIIEADAAQQVRAMIREGWDPVEAGQEYRGAVEERIVAAVERGALLAIRETIT